MTSSLQTTSLQTTINNYYFNLNFHREFRVPKMALTMKKIKAIIERANDGNYSVYMDADDVSYLVTGTGATVEEAVKCFEDGYSDMKAFYTKKGMKFEELEFVYEYDMASFLSYYSKNFSLAGLSRLTGINQGQLSHYMTGRRKPSRMTVMKMQNSIHKFAGELERVNFV